MHKFKKILQPILGLTILGLVGYSFWRLAHAFYIEISSASPEVSAAIIGAMATVLVGILVVLLSQAHERKRVAEEAHRLKKVEVYQAFINMISRMIGASNQQLSIEGPDQKELLQYLFKFKSEILLWGSPKVIKAQIKFEEISEKNNTAKTFIAVNNLYLAIREDIGLSNSGLNNLELIKIYLNNDGRKELE